jgi:hypothetical protein
MERIFPVAALTEKNLDTISVDIGAVHARVTIRRNGIYVRNGFG